MNNKNIASLPQYHPINKSPNFEIRNIIPQWGSKSKELNTTLFLCMVTTLMNTIWPSAFNLN